jgi:NAD(P)-dependent dehydrogenase (short-subunit alcohol dehydrogenase family)
MDPAPAQLLQGDVAVVTGGAQGNGAAIARGLAGHGASVAVLDLDRIGAERVSAEIIAAGGRSRAYVCDVADRDACVAVAALMERDLGPASVLVNNAGVIRRVLVDDDGLAEALDLHLRVNVVGSTLLVQALLNQLIRTGGRVVNVGSIASFISTVGGVSYAASKGAVLQLTKALASELAPHGIRVNGVAPGVMETPMTAVTRSDPAASGRFLAHTPLGRFGRPEELVGPVVFLASPMSSYVTGVMVPVDGGYLTV